MDLTQHNVTVERLARLAARIAAHDVLRNATVILTRAGYVDAALLLTAEANWHECIQSATSHVVDSLPHEGKS